MEMLINTDVLRDRGWVEFAGIKSPEALIEIAENIGVVLPHPDGSLVKGVSPSRGQNAVRGTFSDRFGLKEFPLHTDTAFWSVPARYMALGMLQSSDTNTVVVKVDDVLSRMSEKSKSFVRQAVYRITTPHGQRYAPLFFMKDGCEGFRIDPCCMTPVNKAAEFFQQEYSEVVEGVACEEIAWTEGKVVVMDNWKVLHGRRGVGGDSATRKLFRVYAG